MIVFGCIARNFFGPYMDNYNSEWGVYIRMICLSVILLEGGMELEFEAKGALTLILFMTLVPFLSEAIFVAVTSSYMMQIPLAIALTLGF